MSRVVTAFDNTNVLMEDAYCVNALAKEIDYLISFDTDRLLAGFRENADLDTKGAKRYECWEEMLIGGHTVGHYLTAMAQAYANIGVTVPDRKKIHEMITCIIDGMLECQQHSKGKKGFVFAGKILDPENVELQFDNVEKGMSHIITQVWVPWYTLHKLLVGVVDVYRLTGYENALTLAEGIGDWTWERASSWSEETHKTVLSIEYGGMNDALYALYEISGNEKYARAAHMFDEDALFERVLSGGANILNDKHANTTIPKFVGAIKRYLTVHGKTISDAGVIDATRYLKYARAFWDMVVEHHTYITGGNSEWEHFGLDDILDRERTNCNCETCNVYNMLKLSRMLFEATKDKKYADYYENTFYNAILSSQNPETGMTMYFQPMATGYFKTYGTRFTKFWCCTGSGMENFTKLGDSIYFHDDRLVYVNLYFSSLLNWKEKGLSLEQKADMPNIGKVSFKIGHLQDSGIAPGDGFGLALRIPDWVDSVQDIVLKLNGTTLGLKIENGYIIVDTGLADGSELTVEFPLKAHMSALKDNDRAMAIKYGPVVLSADMGTKDMKTTMTGVAVTIPEEKIAETEVIVLPAGISRQEFANKINDYLIPADNGSALAFKLKGSDLTFGVHYLRYRERYGIYFYYLTPDEAKDPDAYTGLETGYRVTDTVQPGYGQYENDELHDMDEKNSRGVTNDGTYRYALPGGSFVYRMAVRKDKTNYLSLTVRCSEAGKTLKVAAGVSKDDMRCIYEYTGEQSESEKTGEPVSLRVELPEDITKAANGIKTESGCKDAVYIGFSGIDGAESARVCGFIYTLTENK